ELQGIKRGIVERADLILVNKADGDLLGEAGRVAADYRGALDLLRPGTAAWTPEVLTCSALHGGGILEIWQAIQRHRAAMEQSDTLEAKRREQRKSWLWDDIRAGLIDQLWHDPKASAAMRDLEQQVLAGDLLPSTAARQLLSLVKT
ncbi:MAG: methylmalonyl Co-A mutase-associated GTPase MeaB, partial [Geminicoccaceae bacterium]